MRSYVLSIWNMLDPIYFSFTRLKTISYEGADSNIFRIRLTKYKGRATVLSDGTTINKNDTLVKIHLHNVKILKELKDIKSELKKAKIIYRHVQKALPELEKYVRNSRHYSTIKGIVGITFLNKGCERLGFEVVNITNPIYKWFKWAAFLPIELLSNPNFSWCMIKSRKPHYLFMSTGKLINMYRN